jgi:hypothetical protein
MHTGSKDHHYVPQYFLKGFCREDGTFDVYDKQYRKFKKAPQSPATVFFERKRNTVKFRGQWTDKIESLYSAFDAPLSQLFQLIQAGAESSEILEPDHIRLLKIHIAIQFWRLPRIDSFAEYYMKSRSLEQISHICSICIPPPSEHVAFDLLQQDSGFRKYFKSFWLPLATFDLNRPIPDNIQWHICSDSLFIFADPNGFLNFSAPFIFPLTKSRLLVARRRSKPFSSLDPIVSTKISILLYIQAQRYVATFSKSYLEKIIEFSADYSTENGKLLLQREILDLLD